MKFRAAHGKNISRYCVQVRLVETFPKPIRRNRGPELSDSPDLKPAYPTCQVTSSIIRDMLCNPTALIRRFISRWVGSAATLVPFEGVTEDNATRPGASLPLMLLSGLVFPVNYATEYVSRFLSFAGWITTNSFPTLKQLLGSASSTRTA